MAKLALQANLCYNVEVIKYGLPRRSCNYPERDDKKGTLAMDNSLPQGNPQGNPSRIKYCAKCSQWKPYSDFYKHVNTKDGLHAYCKVCDNKRTKERTTRYIRRRHLLRQRYGLTPKQYDQMLDEQGGMCYICKQPETHTYKGVITPLAVDHDHKTGEVRRLLCNECNRKVGILEAPPEDFDPARRYLEEMKNREPSLKIIQQKLFTED